MKKWDCLIIGGGAAGLCAAIRLKRGKPDCEVAVCERLARVGKKLSVTGNGRCNITNRRIAPERYHGENPSFASYALKTYSPAVTEEFFAGLGVPFLFEGDKGYPRSLQASSVVDALRFAAQELGVPLFTDTAVERIEPAACGYTVATQSGSYFAKTVLVCAGLIAGGEKLGAVGDMARELGRLGLPLVPMRPAIVQLKTETDFVRSLKGIKTDALCILKIGGQIRREEFGEVLFCDYGLSGPPILQLSGAAQEGKAEICLDLFPKTPYPALLDMLFGRTKILQNRPLEEFFTGMLHKRVGQTVIRACGLSLSMPVGQLCEQDLRRLCAVLKGFSFRVTGTTGFSQAQVTAGGLSTAAFSERNMMAKAFPGLFAAGEILDIDGDCGGFNLQWAWSSGLCAADGVCRYLSEGER